MLAFTTAFVLVFLPTFIVLAQGGTIPGGGTGNIPPGGSGTITNTLTNPLGATNSLCDLLKKIIEMMMKIGAIIAVVFIIYSGFLFVFARGNEDELKKAKDTFKYTIIGVAVLFGAWTIATVIRATIEQISGTNYIC